jgi:Leucine Rich repeat
MRARGFFSRRKLKISICHRPTGMTLVGSLNSLKTMLLGATQTLHSLRISGCGLLDDGIHILASALVQSSNTTLKVCEIRENGITSNGLPLRECWSRHCNLKRSTCHLMWVFFYDISNSESFGNGIGTNQTLKKLDLGHCEMGDDSIRYLANGRAQHSNTTLKGLYTSHKYLTSRDGLAAVTLVIKSTELRNLRRFPTMPVPAPFSNSSQHVHNFWKNASSRLRHQQPCRLRPQQELLRMHHQMMHPKASKKVVTATTTIVLLAVDNVQVYPSFYCR